MPDTSLSPFDTINDGCVNFFIIAREHLVFYAKLRGVPAQDIDRVVRSEPKPVKLFDAMHSRWSATAYWSSSPSIDRQRLQSALRNVHDRLASLLTSGSPGVLTGLFGGDSQGSSVGTRPYLGSLSGGSWTPWAGGA